MGLFLIILSVFFFCSGLGIRESWHWYCKECRYFGTLQIPAISGTGIATFARIGWNTYFDTLIRRNIHKQLGVWKSDASTFNQIPLIVSLTFHVHLRIAWIVDERGRCLVFENRILSMNEIDISADLCIPVSGKAKILRLSLWYRYCRGTDAGDGTCFKTSSTTKSTGHSPYHVSVLPSLH